jgi:hypothetical protein
MQFRIHMLVLLIHGHAIVGPFITRIEITRAAEAGLAYGPTPPVDHVLKLVFPKGSSRVVFQTKSPSGSSRALQLAHHPLKFPAT